MSDALGPWRAYYADGSTRSGAGCPTPLDPTHGVVCVVQRDPADGSRHVLSGHDWYWYDPAAGQWFGGDVHGLLDFAMRTGLIRAGRFVPNADYDRITTAARSDPDFAAASGREMFNPRRDAATRDREG